MASPLVARPTEDPESLHSLFTRPSVWIIGYIDKNFESAEVFALHGVSYRLLAFGDQ